MGPHCSRTLYIFDDAWTASNSNVKLHNLGIQSRDTYMMSVAQLRQHGSSRTAAAATSADQKKHRSSHQQLCLFSSALPNPTARLPHHGFASGHNIKKGSGLPHKKATCTLPTSNTKQRHIHDERSTTTACLLYTSPSPRDKRQSRMPSSA